MSDAAREAEANAFVIDMAVAVIKRSEERPFDDAAWTQRLAALLDRHAAAHSAALAGRLRGLVEVLREVEWMGGGSVPYHRTCPLCGQFEPHENRPDYYGASKCGWEGDPHGHADDCRLAAALQEPPHA